MKQAGKWDGTAVLVFIVEIGPTHAPVVLLQKVEGVPHQQEVGYVARDEIRTEKPSSHWRIAEKQQGIGLIPTEVALPVPQLFRRLEENRTRENGITGIMPELDTRLAGEERAKRRLAEAQSLVDCGGGWLRGARLQMADDPLQPCKVFGSVILHAGVPISGVRIGKIAGRP